MHLTEIVYFPVQPFQCMWACSVLLHYYGASYLCRRVDHGQVVAIEHGATERGQESHGQQRLGERLEEGKDDTTLGDAVQV